LKYKSYIFLIITAASILCLLNSCSSEKTASDTSQTVQGGVIKISCLGSLENLDPQKIMFSTDWKAAGLLYEGLLEIGGHADSLEPVLAKNWQRLDEGRRYILELRDSVYFHDDPCFTNGRGRKFNAADVVRTFERIADKKTGCPNWHLFAGKIKGINEYRNGLSESISGINILDSARVEFRLTRAYANFLKLLTTSSAYIIPHEAAAFYNENFARHPVGTGAFKLSSWKQLERLSLIQHEKYWRKDNNGKRLPHLDKINIELISNPVLRISKFISGDLDILEANSETFENLKREMNSDEKFKLAGTQPGMTVRFFGFAMDKDTPLAKSRDLRKAIALAFERNTIQPETNPFLVLAETFLPVSFLQNKLMKWHKFSLSAAKETAAGSQSEYENQEIVISSNLNAADIHVLQSSLEKIGLNSRIEVNEVGYYKNIIENRPDIFRVSYYPSYPDPEEYYAVFYSKNPLNTNITGYKNKKYDALFEKISVELDENKRQQIYVQLETILKNDVPVLYLYSPAPAYIITSRVINNMKVNIKTFDLSSLRLDADNVQK